MSKATRRLFIRNAGTLLAALPFASVLGISNLFVTGGAEAAGKDAPLPAGSVPVPSTDAVAAAIGYKANVKDIDYAKYPQRKTDAAKSQFCDNCALYTSVNPSWGKCQMLTSGLVSAKGWCGSYSKKA